MYRPEKLIANNFQSFEKLEYDFRKGKPVVVEGENLTDEGQESNGSGKSAFGEILHYIFLGTSSTGKRDVKLIQWGKDSSFMSLTLWNALKDQVLKIERELFSNGNSSKLRIFINDIDQKDKFSSVGTGNKYILDLLDITADDLKNYFLINSERFVSFFTSPDSGKRSLIGRFSSADKVTGASDLIKEKLKGPESRITELQTLITSEESRKNTLEEQILEEKLKYTSEAFEKEREAKMKEITSYQVRITELETNLEDLEKDKRQIELNQIRYNRELGIYKKAYDRVREFDYDTLINKVDGEVLNVQKKIDKQVQSKEQVLNEYRELEQELQPFELAVRGSLSCPKCHFVFAPSSNLDISEAKMLIPEIKSELENLNKKVGEYERIVQAIQEQELVLLKGEKYHLRQQELKRTKLEGKIKQLLDRTVHSINFHESNLQDYTTEKVRLETEKITQEGYLNVAKKEYESLKQQTFKESIVTPIRVKIAECDSKIESYNEEILQKEEEIQNIRKWGLDLQNFYVYLTNKSLNNIQGYCNLFLQKIKTNLQLKLEGFKTLSDGTVKENINAVICRDGMVEEEYKCFSGGEKGRLILSTILTFQQLINQKSESGGLDLLWVDEVLDKVDALGMKLFVDCLSEVDRTIFLVSQVRIKEHIENTLTVTKENGISYVR